MMMALPLMTMKMRTLKTISLVIVVILRTSITIMISMIIKAMNTLLMITTMLKPMTTGTPSSIKMIEPTSETKVRTIIMMIAPNMLVDSEPVLLLQKETKKVAKTKIINTTATTIKGISKDNTTLMKDIKITRTDISKITIMIKTTIDRGPSMTIIS